MSERRLKVGTRKSPLALKQVDEVIRALREFYPAIKFEIVGIDTYGDKDKITPVSEIEGSDFFTREIEQSLLKGEIDFAVHSAKDLPGQIPKCLIIAAITKSIDPYDALVSKRHLNPVRNTKTLRKENIISNGVKIDQLPNGAKIGVSSLRRKTQLRKYRNDLKIVDIRGNIQERIERLDNDGLDAIVVAACALVRLGLEDRIAQRIPFEILSPHPLQGALAIEVKEDNKELIKLLEVLNEK